jgi:hypothetical protein
MKGEKKMLPHKYFDKSYVPPPTGVAADRVRLDEKIQDLEWCLAGNPVSKKWQEINTQLASAKGELRAIENRIKYQGGMVHVTGERHPG